MILKVYFLVALSVSLAERFTYISTEHPEVTYYNRKYINYANLTSKRYGRYDPFYYVGLHWDMIYSFHNNVTVHFIFYEYLSNRYKPSFVEMHFKFCDLIHKDPFFGAAMKQGMFDQPCPFPPGVYNAYNMSISVKAIPPNFPFTKGRILANITSTDGRILLGYGHIDMEVKEFNTKWRSGRKSG